jgi:hypothetical protein
MQGRPVKRRVNGFDADVTTLTRIRTALKLDARLDRQKVAQAVRSLDLLVESLIELTSDLQTSPKARKSA